MRRYTMYTTVAMVALAGVAALGQAKITTTQEYTALMKSTAQAFGAANKAIGSAAYADARPQLAVLRQNFTTLQGFWSERKKDDAVGFVKDGLTRLDALDKMISAATVDQVAAQAAAKEFAGSTCAACHKTYREGDAQTGFRFKPGVF